MALGNTATGEYIKVTGMQFDFANGNHQVNYIIFANLEQRQRYESGLSPYETTTPGQYNNFGIIEVSLSANTDKEIVKDVLFDAMYKALKAEMFADWIDC